MSPTGPCHGADKHEPRTLSGGWPEDRTPAGWAGVRSQVREGHTGHVSVLSWVRWRL